MIPIEIEIVGIAPLMVNNPQTTNPLHPIVRQIKDLTNKRKRTEADEMELQRLKWLGSLYIDDKLGPYLPTSAIWKSFHEAAKLSREGKTIERGLYMMTSRTPIEYDGPRDAETMYADGRFVDARDASPTGKRITAVRGIFPEWTLHTSMQIDPEQLNLSSLRAIAEKAGRLIGVGTYRRMFGRYMVEITETAAKGEKARAAA